VRVPTTYGAFVQEQRRLSLARPQLGDTKLEAPASSAPRTSARSTSQQLRAKTGYVTLDPAFMNTASTKSAITFLDGEKGILRYRGIPIEQLAEQSTFVETAYLLIYGNLPTERSSSTSRRCSRATRSSTRT
jgi:citrate synthase